MWQYCALICSIFVFAHAKEITTTPAALVNSAAKVITPSAAGFGCGSMCCDGKNNTCHSTGLRINGRGSTASKCFCDEGCPAMGDCCFDYHSACKVVDCRMSEWGNYSECSSKCGIGSKTRYREIEVKPRFGGAVCPTDLRESTICTGMECQHSKVEIEQAIEKETAKIMPATYGKFRKLRMYNADMDIRKNLFYQYYHKNTNKYSGYCSRFRVVSSRSACQSYAAPWANVLKKDAIICVECQQTAMEKERSNGMCAGHGEVGEPTNWNAISARGCTGWWERLEDDQECTCGPPDSTENNFIFI